MCRESRWLAVAVLLGLAFSQQALSRSTSLRVEFEPGIDRALNQSSIIRELAIDRSLHDLVPTSQLFSQEVEYSFEAMASSMDGPGESSSYGAFFNVDNEGPDPIRIDVLLLAVLSATGNTAWANSQVQFTCLLLCIAAPQSLALSPAQLRSAYNVALQLSGGLIDTLRVRETFLATDDTDFGSSVFSGLTGKIDVGLPGLQVAFQAILEPGGRFSASLDTSAHALESTAMANGRFSVTVSAVPEPAIPAMLLVGLGLLGFVVRGRKQGFVLPDANGRM